MRTNIDFDDDLMARAVAAGLYKTKKDAVDAGLQLRARQAAYREILKWRGTLKWQSGEAIDCTVRDATAGAQPAAEEAALHSRARGPKAATGARPRAPVPKPRAAAAAAKNRRNPMRVVDASVWTNFFANRQQPVVDLLAQLLDRGAVRTAVPDLVLFKVLRGFRHERDHRQARQLMKTPHIEATGGAALALAAPQHDRTTTAACAPRASPWPVPSTCCWPASASRTPVRCCTATLTSTPSQRGAGCASGATERLKATP